VIPVYRLLFALLTLAAIITQAVSVARIGIFDPVSYFSYFTIDSNLIASALLLVGVWRGRSAPSPTLDFLRGAGVVYMTVTGVVFTLLLKNVDVDTQLAWVNSVVHELMPLVILADWFIAPPVSRFSIRKGALWLAFPLLWIVYTLIRGAATGKYPYPFLNPANGGYGSVSLYSVAILVFMLLVCAVVVWLGSLRPGSEHPEQAAPAASVSS
jgi:hypothetical protein